MGARTSKETIYTEFTASNRCRLIVLAIETRDWRTQEQRQSTSSALATAKTRDTPAHTRASLFHYFFRRWSRLLATACANSSAAPFTDHVAQPCCNGADGLSSHRL